MSTPSTAVVTPIHTQYGIPHYQEYQDFHSFHAVPSPHEPILGTSSSFVQSYASYQTLSRTTTHPPISRQSVITSSKHTPHISQPSKMPVKSRPKKQPNWHEFYRNGVPDEIIIIDDTPPPELPNGARTANQTSVNQNGLPVEHASKKRRTDQGSTTARGQITYSDHNTPQHLDSNEATISLDRTTSIHTTAPTSMGSHGSTNSNGYNDTQVTGQKRKRVTRQAVAGEKKRKELQQGAFNDYVPPRKPPIKSGEIIARTIREPPLRQTVDDEDGHYIIRENSPLGDRYTIYKLLGQGTFGKVVEAYDKTTRSKCAIKIIRSVQKYRDASKIELRVLSTLAKNDPDNRNKCIHLRDCFDYRNHICIVTDLLGQSVFDFLKLNSFVPFPSSQIQSFARQLLTSVAFLHDLNLIHTDLKPENILLVNHPYQTFTYNKTIPSSSTATQRSARQRRVLLDTEIRLIDFGSATFDDEYHSTVVSTRHYRAPEIILQLGWSYPCDIWSVGCILVEFFTGDALFQTHDNLEHLAMMEAVIDTHIDTKIVRKVIANGRGSNNAAAKLVNPYVEAHLAKRQRYFKASKLDYPNKESSKASRSYVRAMKTLEDIIPVNTSNNFNRSFLDLLRKIFVYDPDKRITAKEALKHPWFNETIVDDGTEALRIRREKEKSAATFNVNSSR